MTKTYQSLFNDPMISKKKTKVQFQLDISNSDNEAYTRTSSTSGSGISYNDSLPNHKVIYIGRDAPYLYRKYIWGRKGNSLF